MRGTETTHHNRTYCSPASCSQLMKPTVEKNPVHYYCYYRNHATPNNANSRLHIIHNVVNTLYSVGRYILLCTANEQLQHGSIHCTNQQSQVPQCIALTLDVIASRSISEKLCPVVRTVLGPIATAIRRILARKFTFWPTSVDKMQYFMHHRGMFFDPGTKTGSV